MRRERLKEWLRRYVDTRVVAQLQPIVLEQLEKFLRGQLEQTQVGGDLSLYSKHGVLRGTGDLSREEKVHHAMYWAYRERAKIALSVAGCYVEGDYLEFEGVRNSVYRPAATG